MLSGVGLGSGGPSAERPQPTAIEKPDRPSATTEKGHIPGGVPVSRAPARSATAITGSTYWSTKKAARSRF